MKQILIFCIYLFAINLASQTCEDSRIECFLSDTDTTGTNMRNSPNGEILHVIKNDITWEIIETFEILDAKNQWLYLVTTDNGNRKAKKGWIFGGLISIYTRNYDNQDINLFSEPNFSSPIKSILKGEREVNVFDVCGQWAYIKYKDDNGKIVEGWLNPEMQCGGPYSTCP